MALLTAASLLLAALAAGQPADPLMERIRTVTPATATPAACAERVAAAARLNGPDLFHASAVCRVAGHPVEASFLMNAGQTRSVADMALIVPATAADSERQAGLYGFIFFVAGGPGDDEVFRDPALRARFWRLYDDWTPDYGPAYDPGWAARRRPEAADYRAAIAEIRAGRRRQLDEIARLFADDAYYALHRRLQALQARTGGTYVDGSADAELSRTLSRQMEERAVALGIREAAPDVPADMADMPDMPPPSPAADETVQAGAADPVVRRCEALAERMTIAGGSRIERVLITASPEWGTIWRADLIGGRDSAMRVTCTERTSASRPFDMGADNSLPPLPGPQP